MMVIAPVGAVPMVGESLTPRYQGPLERLSRDAGWSMGPSTPLWSSQSCVVFVSVVVLVVLGRYLGNLKETVALGFLFWFGLPFKFLAL